MEEEELDPADADALDDQTAATGRAATGAARPAVPAAQLGTPGRLRLRAAVPVAKGYEGKKVSREKLFVEEDVARSEKKE